MFAIHSECCSGSILILSIYPPPAPKALNSLLFSELKVFYLVIELRTGICDANKEVKPASTAYEHQYRDVIVSFIWMGCPCSGLLMDVEYFGVWSGVFSVPLSVSVRVSVSCSV